MRMLTTTTSALSLVWFVIDGLVCHWWFCSLNRRLIVGGSYIVGSSECCQLDCWQWFMVRTETPFAGLITSLTTSSALPFIDQAALPPLPGNTTTKLRSKQPFIPATTSNRAKMTFSLKKEIKIPSVCKREGTSGPQGNSILEKNFSEWRVHLMSLYLAVHGKFVGIERQPIL